MSCGRHSRRQLSQCCLKWKQMQKSGRISMLSMPTQGPLCHSKKRRQGGKTHSISRFSSWLQEPQMGAAPQLLGLRLHSCKLTTVKPEWYASNLTLRHHSAPCAATWVCIMSPARWLALLPCCCTGCCFDIRECYNRSVQACDLHLVTQLYVACNM